MNPTNKIELKAAALHLDYEILANHWNQHPLSHYKYKGVVITLITLAMAMVARNPTCRKLYLAYSLVTKPPFN